MTKKQKTKANCELFLLTRLFRVLDSFYCIKLRKLDNFRKVSDRNIVRLEVEEFQYQRVLLSSHYILPLSLVDKKSCRAR